MAHASAMSAAVAHEAQEVDDGPSICGLRLLDEEDVVAPHADTGTSVEHSPSSPGHYDAALAEMVSTSDTGEGATGCLASLRHGSRKVRAVVARPSFEALTFALMSATSVFTGVEASYARIELDAQNMSMRVIGSLMLVFLSLEFLLRVAAYGLDFFRDPLNLFMALIISLTVVIALWNSDRVVPPVILVRWLGFGRGFDFLKDIPYMDTIWLLISGLRASTLTLTWSWVLTALTVLVFAVFAVEMIGRSAVWKDVEPGHVSERFRNVADSMFAMTRFLRLDGAAGILDDLMERQGMIWIFFVFFQALSVYVMLNLVTGVIVNHALQIVQKSQDHKLHEAERERAREAKQLGELFVLLDENHDRKVTLYEFMGGFQVPAFKHVLQAAGLEEESLMDLFNALDVNGNGMLSTKEFVQEMPKLYGTARAYEMLKTQSLADKCEHLLQQYLLKRMGVDPHTEISKKDQAEVFSQRDFFQKRASVEERQVSEAIAALELEAQTRLEALSEQVNKTWLLVGQAVQSVRRALEIPEESLIATEEDVALIGAHTAIGELGSPRGVEVATLEGAARSTSSPVGDDGIPPQSGG